MIPDHLQEVLDALEYRLAQIEDRVWKDANLTDRRALQHRRHKYYALFNRLDDHA